MSLCLTDDEIYELTHKRRYTAQAKALREMGRPYSRRPDGSIMILRNAIETISLIGKRRTEPNWEALRNAAQTK